ncbi:GNAT family N-acetyltransferase [Celeribacter sp. ULVN23_4]
MTLMQNITVGSEALTIRQARWGDKDALLQMIHALAAHHGDAPELDLSALIDLLNADLPWIRMLVAEGANGRLLGYAALVPGVQLQHGKKIMELHHLYVEEAARGTGVARQLIAASKDLAKTLGCVRLTVSTQSHNTRAQNTYLACGFTPAPYSSERFAMQLS